MKFEVTQLFATQVLKMKFEEPELNRFLAALALHHRARLGMLRTENHCIWQWRCDEIDRLKEMMIAGYEQWAAAYGHRLDLKNDPHLDRYVANAWAQAYDPGGFARLHSHQMADATAIYYATTHRREIDEGRLEIHDPRWVSDEMLYVEDERTTLDLDPEEGMLVVIPGYLWHSVPPYLGSGHRICYVSTLEYSIVRRSLRTADPMRTPDPRQEALL